MDWITLIIGALIGAIVGIPFNIFGDVISSPVQAYLKNRRLSKLQRKINEIVDDYQIIEALSGGFESVVVYFLVHLAIGLIFITLLIVEIGINLVFPSSTAIERFLFVFFMGYGGFMTVKVFYTAGNNFYRSTKLDEELEKSITKARKLNIKPEEMEVLLKRLEEESLDKE